ncbi:unnamed protein product [Closterium sp. NIES-53]
MDAFRGRCGVHDLMEAMRALHMAGDPTSMVFSPTDLVFSLSQAQPPLGATSSSSNPRPLPPGVSISATLPLSLGGEVNAGGSSTMRRNLLAKAALTRAMLNKSAKSNAADKQQRRAARETRLRLRAQGQ